ncbi:MAG: PsbP-related protein [bacterium]
MYLKKTVVLVAVVFFLFASIGLALAQETLPELSKSYTNAEEGFSISYPEGWEEGEPGNSLAWIHDGEGSELVILKDKLDSGMDLAGYVDAIDKWAKENLLDYSQESLENYTLSNEPSMLRVYTFTYKGENGDIPIKAIEAYLVKEGYGYTVICDAETSTYPSEEALFREIIGSFHFTK